MGARYTYVLGVDPGIANFGWALIRRDAATAGNGWEWCDGAVVKTRADWPLQDRLAVIDRQLRRCLDVAVLQPRAVLLACEQQTGAAEGNRRRGTTNAKAGAVHEVVGYLRGLALHHYYLLWHEIQPAAAKKVLPGMTRTASKAQVARAVRAIVRGVPADLSEHTSDALAVAIAGARVWGV